MARCTCPPRVKRMTGFKGDLVLFSAPIYFPTTFSHYFRLTKFISPIPCEPQKILLRAKKRISAIVFPLALLLRKMMEMQSFTRYQKLSKPGMSTSVEVNYIRHDNVSVIVFFLRFYNRALGVLMHYLLLYLLGASI